MPEIMPQPVFSIVIPTYNRPQILAKTLDCLEEQAVDFEYEVIVVDDGSTIPLPDLGFGKGKRSNWKLLRNERNMGRAATRNRGIRESKGEYILMIDDDIWATPGLLQAHYEAQKKIGVGVVVGSMLIPKEVKNDVWNNYYRTWILNLHEQMEKHKDALPYHFFFTGNLSIPKILIEKVGLFDETFKAYSCEDTELGYRLSKANVRMVYESKACAQHFNQETLDSILRKREQWGQSALVLVRKHPELASELSVAGLLTAGKKHYQLILRKPLLYLGKQICRILAIMGQVRLCYLLLEKVANAYYAFGVKEAINVEQNFLEANK
jgi:GT2 family glycosyltransferase